MSYSQYLSYLGITPIVIIICAYVISTEAPVLAFARKHWGVVEKTVQIDFSTRLRLARNDAIKRINYSQLALFIPMVLYSSILNRGESPPLGDLMLGMRYKCSMLVNR